MKTRTLLTLALISLMASSVKADQPETEGKPLFMTRCAACHSVDKMLTGPPLSGIEERRSMDWITSFIQSSQSMIKNGDPDAVAVFEKFNKVPMPDHPDLTPDKIKSILAYINSQSQGGKTEIIKKPITEHANMPLTFKKDYPFFIGYFVVVIMLVLALLFAVQLNSFQRRMRGQNISA